MQLKLNNIYYFFIRQLRKRFENSFGKTDSVREKIRRK